jgi:hypothetical protein
MRTSAQSSTASTLPLMSTRRMPSSPTRAQAASAITHQALTSKPNHCASSGLTAAATIPYNPTCSAL